MLLILVRRGVPTGKAFSIDFPSVLTSSGLRLAVYLQPKSETIAALLENPETTPFKIKPGLILDSSKT